VSAPAGLTAELDKILLQRALGNLVDNALRHTPAGGSIELLARGEDGHVELGVKDSGCGIGPEDLPRVFDRFFRADPSRSTGTGGTGLGLAIVKSIAEMHGGSAAVHSDPGRGTTVLLRLRPG
jgi:signal transduction histidine kinase